ncbi:MAG: hypothetical protein BWX64_00726 [Acidobacteria bacterium ADurb.Bin051]|nr:MAG: hypothetical protein BWX64_00726 [Acidobacteria bacterium ADurb.Bin051]
MDEVELPLRDREAELEHRGHALLPELAVGPGHGVDQHPRHGRLGAEVHGHERAEQVVAQVGGEVASVELHLLEPHLVRDLRLGEAARPLGRAARVHLAEEGERLGAGEQADELLVAGRAGAGRLEQLHRHPLGDHDAVLRLHRLDRPEELVLVGRVHLLGFLPAGPVAVLADGRRLRPLVEEDGEELQAVLLEPPRPVDLVEQRRAPGVVLRAVAHDQELARRGGHRLGALRAADVEDSVAEEEPPHRPVDQVHGHPGAGERAAGEALPEELLEGDALGDGVELVAEVDREGGHQGERLVAEVGRVLGLPAGVRRDDQPREGEHRVLSLPVEAGEVEVGAEHPVVDLAQTVGRLGLLAHDLRRVLVLPEVAVRLEDGLG